MADRKVICWDLDETLGSFRRIGDEMTGRKSSDIEEPIALRHGVKELLQELVESGYTNFVTTSGTSDYAKEALKRTGILPYFQEVFDRESTKKRGLFSDGKNYTCVAKSVNFPDEMVSSNMIVIGDAPGDQPIDLDSLVLIQHSQCMYHDAFVTKAILQRLLKEGNGDFYEGFIALCKKSRGKKAEYGERFTHGTINLRNGIRFELEVWRNPVYRDRVTPVITQIQADKYRRDMQTVP